MPVIEGLKGRFPRLQKIVADGGYRGELIEKVKNTWGGYWKLCLGQKLLRSLPYCPKDRSWKEHSHGLKVTGD